MNLQLLDKNKKQTLEEFKERVKDVLPALRNDFQRKDENLIKFLIARDFHLDKTEDMFRKTMEWRQENDINRILEKPFCHDLDPFYAFLFPGFDKLGHPLFVSQAGRWDPLGVLHPSAKTEGATIITQFCEKACDLCEEISTESNVITRFFGIIDCANFDYKHLANRKVVTTGLNLLHENSQMMINYYPESLYKVVVVNAPSVFQMAWTVVKPLLPAASLAKVQIFGTNKEKWVPYLLEHIDPDVLPSEYGGANTTGLVDCRFEVDRHFMPKSTLELLPPEELQSCVVEPKKQFEVEIKASTQERILWNFKTEDHDIGFKVEFEDGSNVVQFCRVDSDRLLQKGSLKVGKSGTYTLIWDNTYSRMTPKKLTYAVCTKTCVY